VNKAIDRSFDQGLVNTKIEQTCLMVKLCLMQYSNGILMTLKLRCQIKATEGITGLMDMIARIQ
jgi:hypothetical protein